MKGSESIAEGGCPLIKSGRDERSGLGVGLGELATKRTELAAASCLGAPCRSDHHLPPGFDAVRTATLEGGLLLAQVQRDIRPFETAVNTLLALALGR